MRGEYYKIVGKHGKPRFSKMVYRALWSTTSYELFHSNVLSKINFMYSTKESEYKDAKCIFCNGKFFEDEGAIWIKPFSCSMWSQLDCTVVESTECIGDS